MFAFTAGVSDLVLTNGARGGARKLDDGLPDHVNGCNIVVFTLTWSVHHIMTLHYGGKTTAPGVWPHRVQCAACVGHAPAWP